MKIPCLIVLPSFTPECKRRAIRAYGARILETSAEEWFECFRSGQLPPEADQSTRDHAGLFVHAFADPLVQLGNGSIAVEVVEQWQERGGQSMGGSDELFDAVVLPWGGGGLATGVASTL